MVNNLKRLSILAKKLHQSCLTGSVIHRLILVPLNRYGRPNIEPKFPVKVYRETLDKAGVYFALI